jgi:hypothetical protein
MKKLFFLTMAAVLVAVNVNAQFAVKAGYVSSTLVAKSGDATYKPDAISGFRVGFEYDAAIGSGFSVRPGVNYTYFGTKDEYGDLERLHFANVPVDLKFAYDFGETLVYAFAGPRLVIGVVGQYIEKDGSDRYTYDVFTGKAKWKDDEGSGSEKVDDGEVKRPDVQLGFGAGVRYKNVSLEFGYDLGLLNIAKGDIGNATLKRNQLGVSLGYAF